jgi:hypothetical protein
MNILDMYPVLLRLAQFVLHILQLTTADKREQIVSEFLFHLLQLQILLDQGAIL